MMQEQILSGIASAMRETTTAQSNMQRKQQSVENTKNISESMTVMEYLQKKNII